MTKLCLAVVVAATAFSGVALAAEKMEIACRVEYFKYCPSVVPGGRAHCCLPEQVQEPYRQRVQREHGCVGYR
ncbi:hypothetical protein ABIF86_002769 [Bradyrhizobium japonicum]